MSRLIRLQSCMAVVAVLGCCASLRAQSWDALRDLKPGTAVRIRDTAGQEHKGILKSFSADSLTYEASGSAATVERLRVRQVRVPSGARRVRNLLIWTGIGVAIAITADYTVGTYIRNETDQSSGERALTYVIPIGVFGGIGAALPAWRTAYRAR